MQSSWFRDSSGRKCEIQGFLPYLAYFRRKIVLCRKIRIRGFIGVLAFREESPLFRWRVQRIEHNFFWKCVALPFGCGCLVLILNFGFGINMYHIVRTTLISKSIWGVFSHYPVQHPSYLVLKEAWPKLLNSSLMTAALLCSGSSPCKISWHAIPTTCLVSVLAKIENTFSGASSGLIDIIRSIGPWCYWTRLPVGRSLRTLVRLF